MESNLAQMMGNVVTLQRAYYNINSGFEVL